MSDTKLDLGHLRRVFAIVEAFPSDCDLPHALVALEDAFVMCSLGLRMGLRLEQVRAGQAEIVRCEEAKQLHAEHAN